MSWLKVFVETQSGLGLADFDAQQAPDVGEILRISSNDVRMPAKQPTTTWRVKSREWTHVDYGQGQTRMECLILVEQAVREPR